METLGKLFGGTAKVKIMRLCMFHPHEIFEINDLSKKSKVPLPALRKVINELVSIKFLKQKSIWQEHVLKSGASSRKRVKGYHLNQGFPYIPQLRNILINSNPLTHDEIVKKLRNTGKLKFVALSGVFIQEWESRIDLLIVADNIKKSSLERVIEQIEVQIGKELRYAVFSSKEFKYRLNVYDKLIRDILDYPHEAIVNRLGILTPQLSTQ